MRSSEALPTFVRSLLAKARRVPPFEYLLLAFPVTMALIAIVKSNG